MAGGGGGILKSVGPPAPGAAGDRGRGEKGEGAKVGGAIGVGPVGG